MYRFGFIKFQLFKMLLLKIADGAKIKKEIIKYVSSVKWNSFSANTYFLTLLVKDNFV